jgi:hypothetical protein
VYSNHCSSSTNSPLSLSRASNTAFALAFPSPDISLALTASEVTSAIGPRAPRCVQTEGGSRGRMPFWRSLVRGVQTHHKNMFTKTSQQAELPKLGVGEGGGGGGATRPVQHRALWPWSMCG